MSSFSAAVLEPATLPAFHSRATNSPVLRLGLLTAAAVLVHGYHLGVDDAAIYVPAVKRVADPHLYPFGAEFFMSHAHLSWFSNLVGGSARLTGIPSDWAIFDWHVASIFLLLFAAWRLLGVCFRNVHAQWSGVTLLAAVLSVPVAGTALVIMDPYLTARSLSTPATILAIAYFVSNRKKAALACLLLTALVHPQMGVFCGFFLACLELAHRHPRPMQAMHPHSVSCRAYRSSFNSSRPKERLAKSCFLEPIFLFPTGLGMSGLECSRHWPCWRGSRHLRRRGPRARFDY